MDWRDWRTGQHTVVVASSSAAWSTTGQNLLTAARVLNDQIAEAERILEGASGDSLEAWNAYDTAIVLEPTYLLLAGFAVENMLKAILIRQSSTPEDEVRNFRGRGAHELTSLAVRAKLALSSEERQLLQRLRHAIVWAGRSPVPLNLHDLAAASFPEGSEGPMELALPGDSIRVEALVRRLMTAFTQEA